MVTQASLVAIATRHGWLKAAGVGGWRLWGDKVDWLLNPKFAEKRDPTIPIDGTLCKIPDTAAKDFNSYTDTCRWLKIFGFFF